MAMKRNDAYAGEHGTPDGFVVCVLFISGTATRVFNRQAGYTIGTREYRRFGWYWTTKLRATSAVLTLRYGFGPFTSSRLAYQDAMKRNQRRRAAA